MLFQGKAQYEPGGTWQGGIKLPRSIRQKYLARQISEISEYDNFLDANSCRGGAYRNLAHDAVVISSAIKYCRGFPILL